MLANRDFDKQKRCESIVTAKRRI